MVIQPGKNLEYGIYSDFQKIGTNRFILTSNEQKSEKKKSLEHFWVTFRGSKMAYFLKDFPLEQGET